LHGHRHLGLGKVARHVGQIAIDHRLDIGIEGSDDSALIFAKSGVDLG
jgi:hypothetical protein